MKKLTTLLLALLVCACSMLGGLTGCNREEEEAFNEEASHLYVGLYNAGYGTEYAKDLKKRFEEFYVNESFEEGKKGVQIHLSDVPQGNAFYGNITSSDVEVFFTSNTDYYQFVNQHYLLNIDDVVTGSMERYGETRTIESRMDEEAKKFYQTDEGYFAIPYVNSYSGIAMNVDLFESKQLYFAKGGCPSEYLRTNENCDDALSFPAGVTSWNDSMYEFTGTGEKSAGPDGKYGTPDDGEPATYEEFFRFCDNCYDSNVQAFHWPGKFAWTFSQPMIQMIADYEGREQMGLNYNFTGVAKTLIDMDANGNITKLPDETITPATGYRLSHQESKYYVLDFVKQLLDSKNYYDEETSLENATHTHTDAQDDFVAGGFLEGKQEIALLIDGEWWWNEAQPAFDVVDAATNGEFTAQNRRFKMLSFPKATNDKVGEPFTVLMNSDSVCAINAKIDSSKIKMAKEFVKFAFTNASNLQFTKITSCIRPYEYDTPAGYKEGLNYFAKTVVETYETAEKCFVGSENNIYIYNSFNFFNQENFWSTTIGGDDFDTPVVALAKSGKTAVEYFRGMSEFKSQDFWNRTYSNYFN